MYVSYMYIYIYIYIQRERERDIHIHMIRVYMYSSSVRHVIPSDLRQLRPELLPGLARHARLARRA